MYEEEIEKLAESLKNSGLASSIEDAREKAEEMLNKKNKGQEIKVGEKPKTAEEPVEESEEVKEQTQEKQAELFVTKEAEEIVKEGDKEEKKEKADLSKLFYSGNKEE